MNMTEDWRAKELMTLIMDFEENIEHFIILQMKKHEEMVRLEDNYKEIYQEYLAAKYEVDGCKEVVQQLKIELKILLQDD